MSISYRLGLKFPYVILAFGLIPSFLFSSDRIMISAQAPSNCTTPAPNNCTALPPSAFVNDAGPVAYDVAAATFLGIPIVGLTSSFGYEERNQDGHLFGLVRDTPDGSMKIAADGDWGIFVIPKPVPQGFQSNVGLETRFDKDKEYIETEICNKCTCLINHRLPITRDFVQIDGWHVIDNGHGSGVPGFDGGKTEIHPIRSMRIASGGASKPCPTEETFRIAVGAGGTCPDYSFAKVESLAVQSTTNVVRLPWPMPPQSPIPGITFVPAFEINELTSGQLIAPSSSSGFLPVVPLTPVRGQIGGTFPGCAWQATRSGNSVEMSATITVQTGYASGPFESTVGRVFDIRTLWMPAQLELILDSVRSLGIQQAGTQQNLRAFPVRSYRIRAHANVSSNPSLQPLLANLEWRLGPDSGYSIPTFQVIGTGTTLDYIHDIAPSRGLADYDLRLELVAPSIPISVAKPIRLPKPSIQIKEIQRTEKCSKLPNGESARIINVKLEVQTANFASGPNIKWAINRYPQTGNVASVATGTGHQITHQFRISPSSPANYFKITASAVDLNGVEAVTAEEFLNFVPVVQIICQPAVGPPGSPVQLSVETLGFTCNALKYQWHTGVSTPTITLNRSQVDPRVGDDSLKAEVTVTDAAGQSVRVMSYVCGNPIAAARTMRRMEDIEKRQLYRKVNEMRDLMLGYKLVNCDPRNCDPSPDQFGMFANWMKRAVLSANAAVPGALNQRTTFIDRILVRTRETSPKSRGKVLRQLITTAINDLRSGRYREDLNTKSSLQNIEWNQATFRQIEQLVGDMRKRR